MKSILYTFSLVVLMSKDLSTHDIQLTNTGCVQTLASYRMTQNNPHGERWCQKFPLPEPRTGKGIYSVATCENLFEHFHDAFLQVGLDTTEEEQRCGLGVPMYLDAPLFETVLSSPQPHHRNRRIINGPTAEMRNYPWSVMVKIHRYDLNITYIDNQGNVGTVHHPEMANLGSGSIVHRSLILTAAHLFPFLNMQRMLEINNAGFRHNLDHWYASLELMKTYLNLPPEAVGITGIQFRELAVDIHVGGCRVGRVGDDPSCEVKTISNPNNIVFDCKRSVFQFGRGSDVAVIYMDNPLTYRDNVAPVCLPYCETPDSCEACSVREGERLMFSGYGSHDINLHPLDIAVPQLREAEVTVHTVCSGGLIKVNVVTPNHAMAYKGMSESDRNERIRQLGHPVRFASGDSGGAFVAVRNKNVFEMGILSGCQRSNKYAEICSANTLYFSNVIYNLIHLCAGTRNIPIQP